MSKSLHDEVTRAYYKTTAGRARVASREDYERNAATAARRLRVFLPSARDARCLDLGCGLAEMVYLLEREGFSDVTGVDMCAEEIEKGRPFVRGKLVCANVLEFLEKCEPASFDFVTALNFLEHLPKDALLAVMAQLRRVLRPGGTLLAMVPNAVSPYGGLTRHWDITHEWAFTRNNFQQLAALVGFDPAVEAYEWGPHPHGLVSGVRWILWQMLRAWIALRLVVEIADAKGGVYTMDMLVRLRAPAGP
jgi:SAM-dependent methyltransferase